MKKTQRLEAVRTIRRSWVSWLSILIIALLAVTAYLGITFSADGLLRSADACLDAQNFRDIEIRSSGLMKAEDLEAILGTDGVSDAEGILSLPSRVRNDETCRDIYIQTVPERLNQPRVLLGRLPEDGAADECAVEQELAEAMGYTVGSVVTLSARNSQADMLIATKTFTVTGIFSSAEHLSGITDFEPIILVSRQAFNTRFMPGGAFTAALVRIENDGGSRFGKKWNSAADSAKSRLEALNDQWMVTDLRANAGYIVVRNNADNLKVISLTFSMLFILIAALVIYSTISRLVGQESRLVGASKAMGLRNREILGKYLLFGVSGTLTGVILGILIACFLFERIILLFFGTVMLFEERVMSFLALPAIAVFLGSLLLAVLAVVLACHHLMKSSAVSLMSGQAANGNRKPGRKSDGLLYLRLIFRNMRSDWRRILVSIASIAGCCMLMMIGFTLKFGISRVPERQYGDLVRYQTRVTVDPSRNAQAAEEVTAILEGEGLECLPVTDRTTAFTAGGDSGQFRLICTDRRDISGFCQLEDISTGEQTAIPESGLLISRRFEETYDVHPGDTLRVYDTGMNQREMAVAGVVENYIDFPAYCTAAYAEECLGESMEANAVLVRHDGDREVLRGMTAGVSGFLDCTSSRDQQELFDGFSMILNLVILLLGGMAFMIACFILLNLVTTYVNNKKTELTIMRINGYTTRETIRFASLESYATTLIGIVIGLIGGHLMGTFIIRQMEQPTLQFVREPIWISFAASSLVTILISLTIHWMAFRKIRDLKLADLK